MKYNKIKGQIYDPYNGQLIATMSKSATPEQAAILTAAPNLLDLCRRSLRALDEDSFPQLRDDLREAIDKAEEPTA